MRPVNKWQAGQHGVTATYTPHNDAKPVLLQNFGNPPFYHCNYCDRMVPMVNLEVEHIQPIAHNAALGHDWDNFLIACKNCNRTKWDYDLQYEDVVLPHLQNTFNLFIFNNDGTVEANPALDAPSLLRINETIEMLGLNRGEDHAQRQPQDDRFHARRFALTIAQRALEHYENNVPNYLVDIINQAKVMGFWSVWMKVFENHDPVRNALIAAFNNTYPDCMTHDVNRAPFP